MEQLGKMGSEETEVGEYGPVNIGRTDGPGLTQVRITSSYPAGLRGCLD